MDKITTASVITAVTGCWTKLSRAAGARLKPIRATIAPATTGGIRASIHRVPATCTIAPTIINKTPIATIPPSAPPGDAAAVTGAMNANDDPR